MSWGDARTIPSYLLSRLQSPSSPVTNHNSYPLLFPSTETPPASNFPIPTQSIVYWSCPIQDDSISWTLEREMCFENYGLFFTVPCLWGHLLLASPFFCYQVKNLKHKSLTTAIVLTTSTIELLQEDNTHTTIFLENIKSITLTNHCQNPCAPTCLSSECPRLIIDDGRTGYGPNGPYPQYIKIWGHENLEEFRRLIMELKEKRTQITAATRLVLQQIDATLGPQQPLVVSSSSTTPPQGYSHPVHGYTQLNGYSPVYSSIPAGQIVIERDPNAYPLRFEEK